jgi:UDP-glucuronate 4-epimerase
MILKVYSQKIKLMEGFKILITGSAGFIGFHLTNRLIQDGYNVYGLDIINDYYDVNLKFARLTEHGITAKTGELIQSTKFLNYKFIQLDLAEHDVVVKFMSDQKFDFVVNLAAQAGVRYSLDNPRAYIHSNIEGFLSILEGCRVSFVKHLIFASTSSVYGLNTEMPLSEDQKTDRPMALYAATKKANELMAHSYSHLFRFASTGLRFFTVYGPWGRPDMALFLFADAIMNNKSINVFNHGKMIRDFTYVGDIVESIARLIPKPAPLNKDGVPFQVFNIGNNNPVQLMEYIEALETALGKKALKNFMDIQAGDVPATHAEVTRLEKYVNFKPQTTVEEGVGKFVHWYLANKKNE